MESSKHRSDNVQLAGQDSNSWSSEYKARVLLSRPMRRVGRFDIAHREFNVGSLNWNFERNIIMIVDGSRVEQPGKQPWARIIRGRIDRCQEITKYTRQCRTQRRKGDWNEPQVQKCLVPSRTWHGEWRVGNDMEWRASAVATATRYGLDGPGIKSRWGRDFPHPSRPALGPIQPPIQWIRGLFRG
jgi:hypothetical protein